MSAPRIVNCRTCGAKIIFAMDGRNRKHPVEAEPRPGWAQIEGRWVFVMAHADHFQTCPEGKPGAQA